MISKIKSRLLGKKGKNLKKDDFEMGELIGEGGLGLVFKGTEKSTGRRVAVKAMKKEQVLSSSQEDHILSEK